MAAELVQTSPAFGAAIQACAAAVQPFGMDLLGEFEREDGWSTPAAATVGLVAVQAGSALLQALDLPTRARVA